MPGLTKCKKAHFHLSNTLKSGWPTWSAEKMLAWMNFADSTGSSSSFYDPDLSACNTNHFVWYQGTAWHPWVFLLNEKYASPWDRRYSPFYTCSTRWARIPVLLILLMAAQLCCWAVDSTRISSRQALQSSPLQPLSGFADLSPITPRENE